MPQAFLSSAEGSPVRSQRRIVGQSTLGVPDTDNTTPRDVCQNGGTLRISKGTVERLKISSGGAPSRVLPGKRDVPGFTWNLGDVNPVDYGLLNVLANLFGKYSVANPTGSVQRWQFDLDQGTAALPYLTLLDDTDVIPRVKFFDALCSGVTISNQGGNFTIDAEFIVGGYTFFGAGTQNTGSGSDIPTITGAAYRDTANEYQVWEDTPDDLFIQVSAVSGNDLTLQGKIGAAASYSSTFTYTMGNAAVEVNDEAGDPIGPIRDRVKLYLAAGSTISVNDVFQFATRRVRWTQSLATDRGIPAVNTQFYVDGTQRRVEGGYTLTLAWENAEIKSDVSGSQGGTPRRTGDLVATLEIDREIVDLDFQKALDLDTTLAIVIEGQDDNEIAADYPYLFRAVLPAMEVSGESFGVETGGENTNETVTLTGRVPDSTYNWDSDSFDSHAALVVQNTFSAL